MSAAFTAEEARDLFSEAFSDELDANQRARFETALAENSALKNEYEEFCAFVGGVHGLAEDPDEPGASPNLLPGVQDKLRKRSRGRFYRDRYSTMTGARSVSPLLVSLVTLAVLAIAWIALTQVTVTPVLEAPSKDARTAGGD